MNARPDVAAAARQVRVWDPVVRSLHWTVVAGCAVNLILENGRTLHRSVGYVVAFAVAARLFWGFVGTPYARFTSFVPRPAALREYLGRWVRRREPRYVGHNPAGAVMIVALLGLLAGISVTGWMLGLDRFFGDERLQSVHAAMAEALMPLVVLHVLGALIEGFRHRENLIKSMLTGRKRPPLDGDVDNAIDTH
jgi:cytochrome b